MFNALKVKNECVEWIRKFFEENGKGCNAVVGISGGKDSSVVAALSIGLSASFAGEEAPQWIDVALVSSSVAVLGGSAAFMAGVPTLCVYKSRLNKLEKAYNGVGIAFMF